LQGCTSAAWRKRWRRQPRSPIRTVTSLSMEPPDLCPKSARPLLLGRFSRNAHLLL
jgi:hypothetical protein